jgi:hypothetical protein
VNDVVDAARARGINEVLHFTTNRGLVGVLAGRALLSRDDLNEEDLLSSVKLLNCPDRGRDADWTGYVNLSLERVNQNMLDYSYKWHEHDGIWWSVLAFDVEILAEPGVYFTTCNNAHPAVLRAQGVAGFEAMFADKVKWGQYGSTITRPASYPPNFTTDVQAEVLVPHSVSIDYLRNIYVPQDEHVDDVAGYIATIVGSPDVQAIVRPEVFQ